MRAEWDTLKIPFNQPQNGCLISNRIQTRHISNPNIATLTADIIVQQCYYAPTITWLAGKSTIHRRYSPFKPPFTSGMSQLAMFEPVKAHQTPLNSIKSNFRYVFS